jgi:hypothetical protein
MRTPRASRSKRPAALRGRAEGWARSVYEVHDPLKMLEPTADATAVWLLGADTDGRVKLWSQPLDGSPRKIVFEDPKSDIELQKAP